MNEWKEAVTDALVVNWGLTDEHENNPRKAVSDLIRLEVEMALDPVISKDALKLLRAGWDAGYNMALGRPMPPGSSINIMSIEQAVMLFGEMDR